MKVKPLWRVSPPCQGREELALALGISPLAAQLLLNRKLATPAQVRHYWGGTLADLGPPEVMAGMEAAVERIAQAVQWGDPILVHGDYDVDGLAGAAILVLALRAWGVDADYHIPKRLDGYGLSRETIETAAGDYGLLLTADCGITAIDEVAAARETGLDVVITDHHLPGAVLPAAVAVVNPHRKDCPYPYKELSGAGVAFRLVQALQGSLGEIDLRPLLPLVALGTVADVVPLTGENRILVAEGLARFDTGPPGLVTLAKAAGIKGQVQSSHISFGLAPRLNALGRMGDARRAVELFLTDEQRTIIGIVDQIEGANQERRSVETQVLAEARAAFLKEGDSLPDRRVVFAASPGWHPGVIGIVAARLGDEFGCPAFVVSLDGEEGRGSARGVSDWDVHQMLTGAAEHLIGFGGHAQAAGFTVNRSQIPALAAALEGVAAGQPMEAGVVYIDIDAQVSPEQVDESLRRAIERMEPFGRGNPEPVFLVRGLTPTRLRTFGKTGEHLALEFTHAGRVFPAVAFRRGDAKNQGRAWDLLFTPEKDFFRGKDEWRWRLADFAVTETEPWDRDRLLELYRVLKSVRGADLPSFAAQAKGLAPDPMVQLALCIFQELGLLVQRGMVWQIVPPARKLNLEDSPTYRREVMSA